MSNIKAMVVDDTIVYRKIVGDVLRSIPGIDVVGTANNGKIALSKISNLKPDLITLDIEMPEMNGIQVLERLKDLESPPAVIMVSTLTQEGSEATIRALELGAFDFLPKPEQGRMAENTEKIKKTLEPIVATLKRRKRSFLNLRNRGPSPNRVEKEIFKKTAVLSKAQTIVKKSAVLTSKSEIVGIGISTGGPNALAQMIPLLPGNLRAPVLIVQHMPPMFTASLANSLDKKSALTIKEAANGDIIRPGMVFIAPGGKQMKIVAAGDGFSRKIKITDDPPENSCKPSVDYLFRSIAQHYVGRATGVIMTGMGSDGTKGLVKMKENGSFIIAQDQASCTVFGMPKDPIESGLADVIAPLSQIANEIVKTIK
jgi:two-component system chemotaxis response regulator CheB